MARLFSFKPTLTFRGRKFKGLRGFAGKPFHPPLTDVPVTCYVLVAAFDLISYIGSVKGGDVGSISNDFFVSGTHVIIAGAIVSLPTALTGFWDWLKSTPKHTQARRTANAHMATMILVTLLVVGNIVMRLSSWEEAHADLTLTILSLVIGLLVSLGAMIGGTLVYEYGFNVETAGDSPVWHRSETDVLPGEK